MEKLTEKIYEKAYEDGQKFMDLCSIICEIMSDENFEISDEELKNALNLSRKY
jgi:hypothetical protein